MRARKGFLIVAAVLAAASGAMAQKTLTGGLTTGSGPYVPGYIPVGQSELHEPESLLFRRPGGLEPARITTPTTVWEYMQRGIHYQDDLQDTTDAMSDYQTAISMNSLSNNTCQIFTTVPPVSPNVNPPPCMFTPRLRLANLLMQTNPSQAIALFQQVLQIDASAPGRKRVDRRGIRSREPRLPPPRRHRPLYSRVLSPLTRRNWRSRRSPRAILR